jgi:hypothetical protein
MPISEEYRRRAEQTCRYATKTQDLGSVRRRCAAVLWERLAEHEARKKRRANVTPPFLYRCSNTGDNVQAWVADDPENEDLTYV